MREEGFRDAVVLGRSNAEAIELARRHCRHARLGLVSGNSFVGSALGVPLGLFEMRCEHAPPPRIQSPRATDVAIDFYRENCTSCPHRAGTGELPNLATVSGERAAVEQARAEVAQRAADERAARLRARGERRRRMLAGEGHVVRDLGEAMDRIDHSDPRTDPLTGVQEQAARHVLDAATAAPELFRRVLIDTLVELAADTGDSTALDALQALVRAGRCPPRHALGAAVAVLRRQRSVDAGRLLALLGPELRPADLPDVLDRLIELTSGDDGPWRIPVSTDGVIAASRVDLPAVTDRIVTHLASDEEQVRQGGADAARALLVADATRIVSLGPALAASVRGEDAGYAGTPHPAGAALRALAEGWRGEPRLTRQIVEAAAAQASAPARGQLARVPWFLQRFRQPWDASPEATSEGIAFLARRAGGDWGDDAGADAADRVRILAGEIPDAVADHVDALLGAILSLSSSHQDATPITAEAGLPPFLQDMERFRRQTQRNARRRNLAEAVGRCAATRPHAVVPPVQALFAATTGEEEHDRTTRTAMVGVLQSAVSAATLRDILPTTYTALCDNDAAVRQAGIRLWAACDNVAGALPTELTDLSVALLTDTKVIVHRAMLDAIPQLRLPDELAPRLLSTVAAWTVTYAQDQEPHRDVIESAIWSLRSLAQQLSDQTHTLRWLHFALAHVEHCDPHDRERLLTAWWPDTFRNDALWTRLALTTAASLKLVDCYNVRREPLLKALFDQPFRLTGIPFADVEPLSTVHSSRHWWRALEPVELVQSAGRWADAATLARRVEAEQPPGHEGAFARAVAGAVARGGELAQALADGTGDPAQVSLLAAAVEEAVAAVEGAFPKAVDDGQVRATLDTIRTTAVVSPLLLAPTTSDPIAAGAALDAAAERLLSAPGAHASGAQRGSIARAWQITALLLRYDAAVRAVAPDIQVLLQAAKRRAEALRAEVVAAPEVAPGNLLGFLTDVQAVAEPTAAEAAWRTMATVPAPVSLVGTALLERWSAPRAEAPEPAPPPRAVCVATTHGVPVTDVLVLRPHEVYHLGMTVRLLSVPDWAERCVVEPVTTLSRQALSLPRYEFSLTDGIVDDLGVLVRGEEPLHCGAEQPILAPALDCPLQVRLIGYGQDQIIDVAGLRRLRLRPFDPSRDALTDHEQTDSRLLTMFAALDAAMFDTEEVRAFCRFFAACVRAAQTIMFEKFFMRGTRVTEAQFHNELERRLLADPQIGGRLSRRDPVAGGFDDLLHDDIIAELKVSRGKPITVDDCARYVGQPTQYGAGRGSQLSILVVLDHGRKTAPPGVIDNYIDWLKPHLHGLDDLRFPSLVGVLIINTNLPVPSAWSRHGAEAERIPEP